MKILRPICSPIAPAVGAAAVSGVASLGSGFISGAGSKRAAKEAGKQNRELYQMQRADYLEDRAHAEEYDSAAAQRARLEAAGLNPYLAMSGDAGTAQSPANIATHPYESANAGEAIGAGLQNGVSQAVNILRDEKIRQENINLVSAQVRKTLAEAGFQEIANETASARFLAELGAKKWQIRQAAQQFAQNKAMFPVSLQTAQQQLTNLEDSHNLNILEQQLKSLQAREGGIILKYLDTAQQLDLSMKFAEVRDMSDRHQLSEQQMKKSAAEIQKMVLDNSLHDFSVSEIRDLRDAIYQEMLEQSRTNTYKNRLENPDSSLYGGFGESWTYRNIDKFFSKLNPLKGVIGKF